MIPKGIILVSFLLTCTFMLRAQENHFKGRMVDKNGRQPIPNARITTTDSALYVLTDENGIFEFISSKSALGVSTSALGYGMVSMILQKDVFNYIEAINGSTNLKEITLMAMANASKFSSLGLIDLGLNPVKSSQELLRLAPGLFVAQHAGGGKAEQIFLRGFDADHGTDVSVNVDGMPVNMVSHAHGQGYADAHFIIPETVSNLDFGAGPYYTNYGNFTTAGYINLSSFHSIPISRVQVEAGRYASYRTLLMLDLLKKNKDKKTAYLAADYNYTNGPTEYKQYFNRFNIFGKFTNRFSEKAQLIASISAFKSTWNASGQIPERAINESVISRFGSLDPSEGGQTARYNANIVLKKDLTKKSCWENQAYFSRYVFDLFSNFTFFAEDPINGDGIEQKEARNMFGFSSKFIHKSSTGSWKIRSTYAVGLRADATDNSALYKQQKRIVFDTAKLGDINEKNLYAFLQKQISNNKWAFDAGIRLDHFRDKYTDHLKGNLQQSRQETIISPKLNIQYMVSKQLQLYIKTGKGFHSNDTRVAVNSDSRDVLPAAFGYDIGLIVKPGDHLVLNVAAWHLYLAQEFVYVGDAGVIEPSGSTRRQGVDLTARVQFSKQIFASVNLNYAKARAIGATKGMDFIPLAPSLTSAGGLFYKTTAGFNGGLNYRYIKQRPANEDNSITANGYFLLDGVINYSTSKFEIGIAVENILNTKWNEAQFATTSRLRNEAAPVTELHFTPGTPVFAKIKLAYLF